MTIVYPTSGKRSYAVRKEFQEAVRLIASGNDQAIANVLLKNTAVKSVFSEEFGNILKLEIKGLCQKDAPSILRKHEMEDLRNFTWEKVMKEWQIMAPNFVKLLFTCSENPSQLKNAKKTRESIVPAVVSAGCILLQAYNQELSAFQYLTSIYLLKGGAKKILFRRFLPIGLCVAYTTILEKTSEIGEMWQDIIFDWKERIESEVTCEKELCKEIEEIATKKDVCSILRMSQAKEELHSLRNHMHPGISVVGDNVDMRTHARHTSRLYKDRDEHMFQVNFVTNRINDPSLDMWHFQQDPDKALFADLCPSDTDVKEMINNMSHLVSKVWAKNIPWLNTCSSVLPRHLEHKHSRESKRKSEKVRIQNHIPLFHMSSVFE